MITRCVIVVFLFFLAGCSSNTIVPSITGLPSISTSRISPTQLLRTTSSLISPIKTPTLLSSPVYTATLKPSPTTLPSPNPIDPSTSLAGAWRCWDDGSPDPCHRNLSEITFLSDDDGWISGDHGAILHWDGKEWNSVNSPSTLNIDRIIAITKDQAWAVGAPWSSRHDSKRTLLRWDGKTWSTFANPTPLDFIGPMSFVNENDGWAIVDETLYPSPGSYLAHWDGKAWIKVIDTPPLYDIEMLSANDGWAVGKSGVMYRWGGQIWQVYHSPVTNDRWITDLSFVSENDGWAIVDHEAVIRWNGFEWQEMSFPDKISPLRISMSSATAGWIIGDDETNYFIFILWDGKNWAQSTSDQPLIPDDSIANITALPNGEAWGVFDYGDSQIWHWDGISWKPYKPMKLPRTKAMDFISSGEAWIVGEEGYLAHWDGLQLKQITSPAVATLNDVAFLSSENGWAVGDGDQILHWDGHAWYVVRGYRPRDTRSAETASDLNSIAFSSSSDGWAVGWANGGLTNHMLHWNGIVWEEQSLKQEGRECKLTSISYLDQREGWATGSCDSEGGLLHWDGLQWQLVQNPANYWLYSASILSKDNAWAVGIQSARNGFTNQGIVIHWDGNEWIENTVVACPLASILMLADNDGWIISQCGEVYHWNGRSWQNGGGLISGPFMDIVATGDGKIWVLTYNGALFYLDK